jgi:hypothetical protein
MSTFYDDMAATAQEMLGEFGQPATLTRHASGYDPATSQTTAGDVSLDVSATGAGVTLDYRAAEIDGTLVLAGDVRLYLSARAQGGVPMPAPIPGDTVSVAGKTWRVVRASALAPAGQAVLHDVQLRA